MKITLESTSKIVELTTQSGKVYARIWEGKTERGTPVHAYITRICPSIIEPVPAHVAAEFEQGLQETAKPSAAVEGIPLRMIL